ncbi:MAG: helix-turn-helix transcriptional regulator [Opitutaceae bacterium]|nr:helix-turn-helix transcriptional regulator [Opitutaceae bacterium]
MAHQAPVKKPRNRRNVAGKAIHRLRTAANPRITQEDMAGRLAKQGVPMIQSQIAKIEIGERPILDYELFAIAKALKVPVQTLFE